MRYISPLLNKLQKQSFKFFQKLGIHVMPVHYYSPVPDTNKISQRAWDQSPTGLSLVANADLSILKDFRNYQEEFKELLNGLGGFKMDNGSFETVDAESYYGMIRVLKPKVIIEIGSGNSTKLAIAAKNKNSVENIDYTCRIICIEPYPSEELKQNKDIELIQSKLEDTDFSLFDQLKENDILFVDSSHSLKIGNDVYFEYLEIIPNVNPGVYIHVHDIFIPNQYSRRWIYDANYFWTEQYLLQCFLMYNSEYQVILPCNYLHVTQPETLREIYPSYPMDEDGPGSFWMRRVVKEII